MNPTIQQSTDSDTPERRNSKIARLPKDLRDKINTMIQDGVPYLQIIDHLGLAVHDINEMNLSRWKNGGYLDWLREMQFAQVIASKYELALSIIKHAHQANEAGQAVLHIIAANLCEFLVETDPVTLRDSLLSDADKFTRFVNSMVRLAEGGVKCAVHQFNHDDRLALAAKAKTKTPAEKPGISDESLRLAEEKLNLM